MTGIDTGTALLILVVFVLPGFVAVLVRERIYEVRIEETTFDRLLTSVYSSLLIWSVPLLFAIVAGAGREDHSVRTSWDFVFASDENVLLLVTLRDGERLGGFYGRARMPRTGREREISSSSSAGSSTTAADAWSAPRPTTSGCGSMLKTLSRSSGTLWPMDWRNSARRRAAAKRRKRAGVMVGGHRPLGTEGPPKGPVEIGPPIIKPKRDRQA